MKRFAITLGLILLLTPVTLLLTYDNFSFAKTKQPGCCMYRKSRDGEWYRKNLNFDQCMLLNNDSDGDDIYQPTGRVWWNRNC
jgi:hypothetical protein